MRTPTIEVAHPARLEAQPMESKVKLLGQALHQMLVVFPLGLLTAAGIFTRFNFSGKDQVARVRDHSVGGPETAGFRLVKPQH